MLRESHRDAHRTDAEMETDRCTERYRADHARETERRRDSQDGELGAAGEREVE